MSGKLLGEAGDRVHPHGYFCQFSGVNPGTFRKWRDQDGLEIGQKNDAGHYRYNTRELLRMWMIVQLTNDRMMTIDRAMAIADWVDEWAVRLHSYGERGGKNMDIGIEKHRRFKLAVPMDNAATKVCKTDEEVHEYLVSVTPYAVIISPDLFYQRAQAHFLNFALELKK